MGFMERTGHPDLFTFCGTCCAEVLRAAGQWDEGEGWLTRPSIGLRTDGQKARCVHPATRLASLRVSQGRLEEAEQLLQGYEDLPEAVQAMVALHMARGQTALAAARLHRRLNEVGRDTLLAVPLLAQLIDVQLVQPDLDGGARTAEELAGIATRSGDARAEAEAALAMGSIVSATGNPVAAGPHFDRSLSLFVRLRMPHASARAHLASARALAESDRGAAVAEGQQALATSRIWGPARRRGPRRLSSVHSAQRAGQGPSTWESSAGGRSRSSACSARD